MTEYLPISGHTKLVALLGSPVAHSLSPALNNFSFKELGVDARYLAFDVTTDDLGCVIPALKAMGAAGANVTMPCKNTVIPYLDELSDAAKLDQAVNVIKFEDGKAIGHNTDGIGFVANLRHHGLDPEGKTITLLGAGGAGSAILVQLALEGAAHINVFVRRGGHSWNECEEFLPHVAQVTGADLTLHALDDADDLKACIAASDVVANATKVGMGEGNTDTLVPPEFMRPGLFVADACYFPPQTQLLKDAAAQGATPVDGLGMLVEQAAAAEKIWFGIDMPVAAARAAVFGN